MDAQFIHRRSQHKLFTQEKGADARTPKKETPALWFV